LFLWSVFLLLSSTEGTSSNSTILAFAANEGASFFETSHTCCSCLPLICQLTGFQYKLVAVLERIRYMKQGRKGSYRLIGFDLGLKPAEVLACVVDSQLSKAVRMELATLLNPKLIITSDNSPPSPPTTPHTRPPQKLSQA
jgi:hypothetical protein